jgi:hypothetical protein
MRRLCSPAGRGGDKARGQILVMFGLGLIIFLGFSALTIDIGFLLVTQRGYQNAADEAALAGSVYLTRPINDPCADLVGGAVSKHDCAREAAWRYLRDDLGLALTDADITLFKASNEPDEGHSVPTNDGGPNYQLWVSTPPNDAGSSASMSTVGDNKQVLFVRVDRVRSPFVAGVLGIGTFNVSSWATAGILPDRWAVMTLRRGEGSSEIDPGPADTTDMKLSGTGAELHVVNGDAGGNWGMKLAASSILRVTSNNGDEANVYLIDYISCGNSCWSSGQVLGMGGANLAPKKLPAFVNDPNYAAPRDPGSTWPNGLVNNTVLLYDIPNGDTAANDYSGPAPNIRIREGSVDNSNGTCVGPDGTQASAPRLGPGTYGDIRVDTGNCLILDPVRTFTDPELGLNGEATPGGNWTWTLNERFPGIYYVTGNFDIQTNALIVGDGVTVIMRPPGSFRPSGGGAMDLNRGKVWDPQTNLPDGDQRLGAWTTKGKSPYDPTGSPPGSSLWQYQTAQEADKVQYGVGIAMYVLKPGQVGLSDSDGTEVIKVSSGSALAWSGVTYAPNDNVTIAGQPNHDGIGQLISWTFAFVGNTNVTQTFDGVGDGPPYLIEPCIQVAGACQ